MKENNMHYHISIPDIVRGIDDSEFDYWFFFWSLNLFKCINFIYKCLKMANRQTYENVIKPGYNPNNFQNYSNTFVLDGNSQGNKNAGQLR